MKMMSSAKTIIAILLLLVFSGISIWRTKSSNDPQKGREAWTGARFPGGLPDFRLSPRTFFETSRNAESKRKVFAWYMLCCQPFMAGDGNPMEQRVIMYEAEIQMAQSMGIDGFGLELGLSATKENLDRIEAMFQAAKALHSGFKLFLIVDPEADPERLNHAGLDIIDLVRKYHAHENYQMVDGFPLLCSYGADGFIKENNKADPRGAIEWWNERVVKPLANENIKIFFVPTTFRQFWEPIASEDEIADWGDVAQGLSMWQIQTSPCGTGLNVLEHQAIALHEVKKAWMSTLSTHYWCGSYQRVPSWYWEPGATRGQAVNGLYSEGEGGKGLDAQWRSVIDVQRPEWVMMLTWNDYSESYTIPIDDYKKYKNDTAKAPIGWYKSYAGLDELNRYYVQWYKTGQQPKITADGLFYNYRTHSYKLVAAADPRPPVNMDHKTVHDVVYLTTALTSPARLVVESGKMKYEYDVPEGIAQTVAPFKVGRQSFSLWRNGSQILTVHGEPVVDSIRFYDYWPTTGYASTLTGY